MADAKKDWFELSHEGWRVQSAGRPLASLIYEGIQNAFDQTVTRVTLDIDANEIVIEDNCSDGFGDPELAYTVFLTDKGESANKRGRHGRGLKEMISAMDSARLESVGFTMVFDHQGRRVCPGNRKRGTRLLLRRQNNPREIEKCLTTLRMLIPPDKVEVRINGKQVSRPPRYAILSGCTLDTVVAVDGAEKRIARDTTVTLHRPRDKKERPQIFEMGLPVQPAPTPWHLDVGQRLVLSSLRDRVDDDYRLQLLALLFESLIPETLSADELRDDWVNEVVSSCRLSERALKTYSHRAFPLRSVLPASAALDDRARQSGANVLDPTSLSKGQLQALGRVMENSEQFVERRQQQEERVRATQPYEQRAVAFFTQLGRRILGHGIKIRLMRKAAEEDGIIINATFDRKKKEMSINILGKMDLRAPLSPATLGIFFHELAHTRTHEHNFAFIESLETIAGKGAMILAQEGRTIAQTCGLVFPGPEAENEPGLLSTTTREPQAPQKAASPGPPSHDQALPEVGKTGDPESP